MIRQIILREENKILLGVIFFCDLNVKARFLGTSNVFYVGTPVGCILSIFVSSHIFPHLSNVLAF